MKTSRLVALGLALSVAATVSAQVTVDGTIAGDSYGPPSAVQMVQTQFGDANPWDGSELDAAYCEVRNGRLYLALTGNIQNNFNKLEIFIDSKAGGENTLSGVPGNDGSGNMTGLTFDAGFAADYHVIVRRGWDGSSSKFDLDIAELGTANFSSYFSIFGNSDNGAGSTGTGPANASAIEVAYNNANTAGVTGGDGPADQAAAAAVQTGLELSISLADLGSPSGAIKVLAFQNGGNHDYASNQFLGSLVPSQSNLGGDGNGNYIGGAVNFDLNNFAGDQYFVCNALGVPTVSQWGVAVLSLMLLVGCTLVSRRQYAAKA